MDNLDYTFQYRGSTHHFELAFVAGTPKHEPFDACIGFRIAFS